MILNTFIDACIFVYRNHWKIESYLLTQKSMEMNRNTYIYVSLIEMNATTQHEWQVQKYIQCKRKLVKLHRDYQNSNLWMYLRMRINHTQAIKTPIWVNEKEWNRKKNTSQINRIQSNWQRGVITGIHTSLNTCALRSEVIPVFHVQR